MSLTDSNIWKNKISYYSMKVDIIGLILISIYDKWIQAGMSLAQILLLQGIFGLLILFAEFPSGVLADIKSRRLVLFLGQFCLILGIFVYYVTFNFFGFILAELFLAFGLAFKSGTDTAFAYDSYLEIKQPEESDNLISRGQQLMLFGNIFMLSLGGVLTSLNASLPFIIAIFGYILSSLILLIAIEPIRSKSSSSKLVIKKSIGFLNHPVVIKVLLMLLFLQVVLRVAFWGYIPQLSLAGLDPSFLGIVLGGANLIAFLSALWAKRNKESKFLVYLIPLGVLGLFLMLTDNLIILLIAITFHQISRGIIGVINNIYLNRIVSSDVRASIASLLSTLVSLVYFLFSVVVDGLNLDQENILLLDFSFGILFIISWIVIHYFPSNVVVQQEESLVV